jgi:FkbM family methyltransferase
MRSFELLLPDPSAVAGTAAASAPPASALPFHGSPGRLQIEVAQHLYVPKCLHRTGLAGYEPETLACFLATISLRGGPVFDVGANVGVFSLVAAALSDVELVAFEPTPELAAVARTLADRNDLRFTVEEIALGAESGTATFHLSDVTDSSNSLLDGFRPSATSIEVVVESLDDHCARTGTIPRVLKIDTEATEPDVFRGGLATIREHRPWIVCEVLARRTETQLEEVLEPLGYTWYQITSELPLVPRRELFGDRAYRFNNWLFAPEPPDPEFWERMGVWREALKACVPTIPVAEPSLTPAPSAPMPSSTAQPTARPTGTARSTQDDVRKADPAPRPARRKGVYGRKKLLAGIVGGAVFGAAGSWLAGIVRARR